MPEGALMPNRPVDPMTLTGEALRRWYLRTPEELEQERQAKYDQKYREFFGNGGQVNAHAASAVPQQTSQNAVPRKAGDGGFRSPLDVAQDALHDFQNGPKIQRPNTLESFIPVVGPAWEAAADLQEGNYGGAAFNAAMAVGDALPVGAIVKGTRAATKGIKILKEGSVTAGAAAQKIRKAGLAGKGEEIHHSVPLNGLGRSEQSWKNHYAFLKTLPQETHRRIHGAWNGKPQFDPIRRVWHGTTDWQKSVPAAFGSYAADAWENVTRSFGPPPPRK
jgi:hypothetical protein